MDQHRSETRFTADKKIIVPLDEIDEDEITLNTQEAIIDKRTFELAQNLFTRDRRIAPNKNEPYLFSGFLVCGDCKKSMIAKKAKKIVYYYCSTYLKRSKLACTKHSFREDLLKETILKVIQLEVALAISMDKQVEAIKRSSKINNISTRIEKLLVSNNTALVKQETILDNIYYDWKNGDITREQHQRIKSNTEEKINQIKNAIKELLNEKTKLQTNIQNNNQFLETFIKYQNITELDRKTLVELIDKIYIYENNQIETSFNFQDEYKLTLEFIKNNR